MQLAESAVARPSRAAPSAGIAYGSVHYEGLAYLVLPAADASLCLDALCRHAVDRSGLSRYGTPGEPTWYMALDPASATAEVCYHALNDCSHEGEPIVCAMYQLRVRGRFADLHGRERRHPELIADDYRVTRQLARDVRATRLHGLLYPSARSNGFCIAAFRERVLHASRFLDFVSMRVQSQRTISLCPAGSARWRRLHRDDLQRL